jgi:Flp pilus assembly pilin Flp
MTQKLLHDLYNDEGGQDIVEYALLLVLIAAVSIFILTAMGLSVTKIFSKINTILTSASNASN